MNALHIYQWFWLEKAIAILFIIYFLWFKACFLGMHIIDGFARGVKVVFKLSLRGIFV